MLNASSPGWALANELGFIRSRGIFDADAVVFVLNTKDLTQSFARPLYQNRLIQRPISAIGEAWERYVAARMYKGIVTSDPGSGFDGAPDIETGEAKKSQGAGTSKEHSSARWREICDHLLTLPEGDTQNYGARWE